MRLSLRLIILPAVFLAGQLGATTVVSCSLNGVPLPQSGCYSLTNFSVINETLDLQKAYGTADQANGHNVSHNPVTSGPWIAPPTNSGLIVSTDFGPTFGGTDLITRVDNFAAGDPNIPVTLNDFPGTFARGDHLLTTSGGEGAIEFDFNRGIAGILFRISNGTSGDVDATLAAYGIIDPTNVTTPLATYRITATGSPAPGGTCLVGFPCNSAPFIGVQSLALSNIRSVVISLPPSRGSLFIDTLLINDAPEPGTFVLTGIVAVLAVFGRRRILRERRP